MFELTNAQRKCFGLPPVDESWSRVVLKPGPYDHHTSIAYLDGNVIRKFVATGSHRYLEYTLCEQLSEDLQYLLPKTAKGKPVRLTGPALDKRTPTGMCLTFFLYMSHGSITLYNYPSQRDYYNSHYDPSPMEGIADFAKWVDAWCAETTEEDLLELADFAAQPRKHVKFREGDIFRFKLNRRLYGYGRILLDYDRMRKEKVPFWDILMGKPVDISIYHIATTRKDITVDELSALRSLPSDHMMDNFLFYGDYEIIGNIPIGEWEDYPIMYGETISAIEQGARLQCGKLYRSLDEKATLGNKFSNGGVGFYPICTLPILLSCIQAGSNEPYWYENNHRSVDFDLRNPKLRAELEQVCEQFGIALSDLVR